MDSAKLVPLVSSSKSCACVNPPPEYFQRVPGAASRRTSPAPFVSPASEASSVGRSFGGQKPG